MCDAMVALFAAMSISILTNLAWNVCYFNNKPSIYEEKG